MKPASEETTPMESSKLDQTNATCSVYTFKEGLLSSIGHDLVLELGSFGITLAPNDDVTGSFDLRTLRVRGSVHDNVITAFSSSDKARIEEATWNDVLRVDRYETATVRGKRNGDTFTGTLTLHGASKPLVATLTRTADERRMIVPLTPSDFGIKPFRAMLGALRVEDRVRVELAWKDGAISERSTTATEDC